jgi:hypothetical protein
MKLKAPSGVGDPCVAGVAIISRDGIYDVDAAIGALLIEAFGFVEINEMAKVAPSPAASASPRQGPPWPKLVHPAWRTKPAAKNP